MWHGDTFNGAILAVEQEGSAAPSVTDAGSNPAVGISPEMQAIEEMASAVAEMYKAIHIADRAWRLRAPRA
jgi:hypothetical protein